MWNNLWDMNLGPWNLVVRGVVVYLSVLILLRISGKREMGQMSATDFVAILLISNAVQNSMNGGDNSLSGGLLLAVVLVVMSTLIAFLTYKSKFFTTLFEGTPTILIHNGKMVRKNMRKELMNETELHALLRKQGVQRLDEVETAILEADGTVSFCRLNESTHKLDSKESI